MSHTLSSPSSEISSSGSGGKRQQKHKDILVRIASLEMSVIMLEELASRIQEEIPPPDDPNKSKIGIGAKKSSLSEFLLEAPETIQRLTERISKAKTHIEEMLF